MAWLQVETTLWQADPIDPCCSFIFCMYFIFYIRIVPFTQVQHLGWRKFFKPDEYRSNTGNRYLGCKIAQNNGRREITSAINQISNHLYEKWGFAKVVTESDINLISLRLLSTSIAFILRNMLWIRIFRCSLHRMSMGWRSTFPRRYQRRFDTGCTRIGAVNHRWLYGTCNTKRPLFRP